MRQSRTEALNFPAGEQCNLDNLPCDTAEGEPASAYHLPEERHALLVDDMSLRQYDMAQSSVTLE